LVGAGIVVMNKTPLLPSVLEYSFYLAAAIASTIHLYATISAENDQPAFLRPTLLMDMVVLYLLSTECSLSIAFGCSPTQNFLSLAKYSSFSLLVPITSNLAMVAIDRLQS